MTTYNVSAILDGTTLAFDVARDRLFFDDVSISAADLRLSALDAGGLLTLRLPNLGFTLAGPDLSDLGSADLRFANGSLFERAHSGNDWATVLAGGPGNDLLVGSAAPAGRNMVSQVDFGARGNGSSRDSEVSADGRFVAFSSNATNLVAATAPAGGLFVKDMLDRSIERIADDGERAVLSASGQRIAFQSTLSNLVAGDTNGVVDVFVHDVASGATRLASSSSLGTPGNGASGLAAVSANGRYVAFTSAATNFAPGDSNGATDVFVKDLQTGTIVLASATSLTRANAASDWSTLSADGRLVAFHSDATNLTPLDVNSATDVFVRSLATGSLTLVSITSAGTPGNAASSDAEISASGRYVVFTSGATNLVGGDTNGTNDVFVRDLKDGITSRVSTTAAGAQANAASGDASISGDGRYVVFGSVASTLVAGDTNAKGDIFVKDLTSGAIARVSVLSNGGQANGDSFAPEISADGSRITFTTRAPNLTGDISASPSTQILTVANPLLARSLSGGEGNDVYLVANAADQVVEDASAGTDTVRASVSYTLPVNVENLELLGTGNFNATGNAGANLITGNAGNNTIDGGTGPDTASYANAADGVSVDLSITTAQDTGGAGVDTLVAIESLVGSAFDDALLGSAAGNRLDGGAGADLLIGGGGSDTYVVDNPGDEVVEDAAPGNDFVRSRIGWTLGDNLENLVLTGSANVNGTGNALDNSIAGNRGANRLDGGAGTDTVAYADAASGVNVGLDLAGWQNTLGGGVDRLRNFENLGGSTFNDTLHGDAGDNLLIGGSGTDTVSYARAGGAVTVGLSLLTPQATGGAGVDTIVSFETLVGSAFGDTLRASTAIASRVEGGAGDDTLTGPAGTGIDTLAGGAGDDRYVLETTGTLVVEAAGAGADLVVSSFDHSLAANVEDLELVGNATIGTGNTLANVIRAGAGNQDLRGGDGNDTLIGGDGVDTLTGGAGSDSYEADDADFVVEAAGGGTSDLVISTASFVLPAEVEALWLAGSADIDGTGNATANFLQGNAGANILDGGGGDDTMQGQAGDDTYVVDAGDVILEAAGGGIDEVVASATHTLGAEVERLTLVGTANLGGTGNALANRITGNAGANAIDGGAGADTLTGGAGIDTFRAASLAGADTVTDFVSGTDKLLIAMTGIPTGDFDNLIEGAVATPGTGGFSAFAELVVVGTQVAGALTTTSAAAAIGSATSAYTPLRTALFAVDNGTSTAVYRFEASNLDAVVSAGELTLVALLTATPGVALLDFGFGP